MQVVTRVLGWGIIALVSLAAIAVSIPALAFLAYQIDRKASVNQPVEGQLFTVVRVVSKEAHDGATTFTLETRDSQGNIANLPSSFPAAPGDHVKWRYRRTRWLHLPIDPPEVVQCPQDGPC